MREVSIPAAGVHLRGELTIPEHATVLVLVIDSGGRWRDANRGCAQRLHTLGIATLSFDLLTPEEQETERQSKSLRFAIDKLTRRVIAVTDWIETLESVGRCELGYFAASTAAAAALAAAAHHPDRVKALASLAGRPDLAIEFLPKVRAATLLVIPERDQPLVHLNERAFPYLRCAKRLEIIAGVGGRYDGDAWLGRAADLCAAWLNEHAVPIPAFR
ncbi:MAG TPA: hypothetical protein VF980_00620 [Thermoanaerobaculia bacterium]